MPDPTMTPNWNDPKVRRGAMNKLMTKLRAEPNLLQSLKANPANAGKTLGTAGVPVSPGDLKVLQDLLQGRPVTVQVDLDRFAVPKGPFDDNDLWGNWPGMWTPGRPTP